MIELETEKDNACDSVPSEQLCVDGVIGVSEIRKGINRFETDRFAKTAVAAACGLGTSKADLLNADWASQDKAHFVALRNASDNSFKSVKVDSIEAARSLAAEMTAKRCDVYLAVAEFEQSAQTRKSQDVACVRGFWLDIDVGSDKAAKGQGYASQKEAKAALKAFRKKAGLPKPTHVFSSGSGLHVYFVLKEPIAPSLWQTYAKMLKALTVSLGLLADPTRTADIASLMRFPGTINFKDQNQPRPVELLHYSGALLEVGAFLEALEAAYKKHVAVEGGQQATQVDSGAHMHSPLPSSADATDTQPLEIPPELQKLASALKVLDPDCDEKTWTIYSIVPMINEARAHPELAMDIKRLARSWSSGVLRGKAANAWSVKGKNGKTGERYFEEVWDRFMKRSDYDRVSLGSIFYRAKEQGWEA